MGERAAVSREYFCDWCQLQVRWESELTHVGVWLHAQTGKHGWWRSLFKMVFKNWRGEREERDFNYGQFEGDVCSECFAVLRDIGALLTARLERRRAYPNETADDEVIRRAGIKVTA